MGTPKRVLHLKAVWWRVTAILFDYVRSPKPPLPSFKRRVPLTLCHESEFINIHFYVPKAYHSQRRGVKEYPIVVNFHDGGFTLGSATDDGFWARVVVNELDAVFVSVEYRLAPEYPFATAVDDGVETVYYLALHAQELGLDPSRICLQRVRYQVALRSLRYPLCSMAIDLSSSELY
jgi:acetyl esterase/lipase